MSLDETYLDEIPPLKLAFLEKRDLIQEAIDRGEAEHTIEEIEERLDEGYAQFFVTDKSAMVVEIIERAGENICHIWLAAGDMMDLIKLQEMVGHWARDNHGCNVMTLSGPRWKGWSRVLEKHGFEILIKRDLI